MTFTYIDGALIVIMVLFTVIFIFRGFARSVLNFFSGIVKLLIAFFLSKPVANLITNWTRIDDSLINKFHTWSSGFGDSFNVNLVGMTETQLDSQINVALSEAKFPRILKGIFKSLFQINPDQISGYSSITVADMVSNTLSRFTLIAISFILIFVILFIVVLILKIVIKRIFASNKILFRTDKTLGGILGFCEGAVVIAIIFGVLSIFQNSDVFAGFFNVLNKSILGRPLYKLVSNLINNYMDIGGSVLLNCFT